MALINLGLGLGTPTRPLSSPLIDTKHGHQSAAHSRSPAGADKFCPDTRWTVADMRFKAASWTRCAVVAHQSTECKAPRDDTEAEGGRHAGRLSIFLSIFHNCDPNKLEKRSYCLAGIGSHCHCAQLQCLYLIEREIWRRRERKEASDFISFWFYFHVFFISFSFYIILLYLLKV